LNIENESDDFLNGLRKEDNSSTVSKIPEEDITPYTLWIKNELEPYVSRVILSKRLSDTPILITSQVSATMKTMMAMMQQDKESSQKDYTVEINPNHGIIVGLNKLRKTDPRMATMGVKQLFETAMLQSNLPISTKDYVKRSFTLLDILLDQKVNKGETETPVKIERLSSEALKEVTKENKKNADLFSDFKVGGKK